MLGELRLRDLIIESIGSLTILASILPIYFDALQFQDSSLVFIGVNRPGYVVYEYIRETIFFKFWICNYWSFYAGYNTPLAFYVVIMTIFTITILRESQLKILLGLSYILALNFLSYLLKVAFEVNKSTIDFAILGTFLLMISVFVGYLYSWNKYQHQDLKSDLHTLDKQSKFTILGSFLVFVIYLSVLHIDPVFQSDIVGYSTIILMVAITIQRIEHKKLYVITILVLTLSFMTWWIGLLGFVFIGAFLALILDESRKKQNKALPVLYYAILAVGIPLSGILYILSLVLNFEGVC